MTPEMGRLFVMLALKHDTTVHGRRCDQFDLAHHDEAGDEGTVLRLSCATCGVVLHRVSYDRDEPPDATEVARAA